MAAQEYYERGNKINLLKSGEAGNPQELDYFSVWDWQLINCVLPFVCFCTQTNKSSNYIVLVSELEETNVFMMGIFIYLISAFCIWLCTSVYASIYMV